MFIEIHGFNAVVHRMEEKDLVQLCDKHLKISYDSFDSNENGKYITLKYALGNASESVFIRYHDKLLSSQTIVNLKGSFFDNSPQFKLKNLLSFLSRFDWNPTQLDIAFVDDQKCLTIEKIIAWCNRKDKYCTGSLVARKNPEIVSEMKRFSRVQLGSAKSVTNYGTIYVRPDTGYIRIEIKVRNADKIRFLLKDYDDKNPHILEVRSRKVLVGCIDFIKSISKKTRKPELYVRQSSWKKFLGSNVRKAQWKQIVEERRVNRVDSDAVSFERKIRRIATMTRNTVARLGVNNQVEDIFEKFEEYSGYKLVKADSLGFGFIDDDIDL